MSTSARMWLCAAIMTTAAAVPARADSPPSGKVTAGDVAEEKGELLVKGKTAVVSLGGDKLPFYQVTAELQLAPPRPRGWRPPSFSCRRTSAI